MMEVRMTSITATLREHYRIVRCSHAWNVIGYVSSFCYTCPMKEIGMSIHRHGSPAFADLPLESVYRPSWNLLRLTGRGLDASLENFSVSATPDGTVFIMR